MKVFQVYESYPLFYQPYIPPVIDALQEIDGVEIEIVAFKGDKAKTHKVIVLPNYKIRNVVAKIYQYLNKKYRSLDYFEIMMNKEQVDIIHVQHSFLYSKVINLLNLPKENRPQIIITLRGGDTYVKPWINNRWSDFYKYHGNRVDAFITMSEHQRNYLSEKWGVDKDRVHVIPISFGQKSDVVPKLPNQKKIKIVSVFRMCWEKNIDGNLRTVRHLVDQNFTVQYDLYGDGPDAGQAWYLIDKYKLAEYVNFRGRIENKLLIQRLADYDFLLQLSHSEALPTTVLEAQSLGLPVIVSNRDGLPEAIIDGKTGYTVDPNNIENAANKIVLLWENPKLYSEFSKEAIQFVNNNFTTECEVKRILELYKKLIKS